MNKVLSTERRTYTLWNKTLIHNSNSDYTGKARFSLPCHGHLQEANSRFGRFGLPLLRCAHTCTQVCPSGSRAPTGSSHFKAEGIEWQCPALSASGAIRSSQCNWQWQEKPQLHPWSPFICYCWTDDSLCGNYIFIKLTRLLRKLRKYFQW